MCVYIYILYIYVCMYICIHTRTHTRIPTYICTYGDEDGEFARFIIERVREEQRGKGAERLER